MKADIYFFKIKIVGIFFFLMTISSGLLAQQLCDGVSCITASLAEFDGTIQTIPGYEDIGDTELFCGYEDINILGIFVEIQGGGSNPIWSFNGMTSNDAFFPINSDGVITIGFTTDVSSCNCQVILNPPPSPEANDVTISDCDEDGTVDDYDLNMIDQSSITSSPNTTITYHNTQVDAENNIDAISIKTVVDGSIVHARVEANGTPNCFSTSTITFAIGQNPTVNPISAIQTVDCNTPQATINANANGGTPDYSYNWATNDGIIVGPTNMESLVVSSAGTYMVLLTDDNGCIATGQIIINEDFTTPEFDATPISTPDGTEINCDISVLSLIANATSPDGSAPSYEWTTTDGNISGATNQATTMVTAAGTYTVTVTHPTTGCMVDDNIVITEVGTPPTPEISPNNPTLTCSQTEITLMGSSTGTTPLTFMWSTGETTEMINVTVPDTYTLTVTDGIGCEAITSTLVDQSLTEPTIIIATPEIITCNNMTIELDASDSEIVGMTANYIWTTSDGNIVSGNNLDKAIVDASGTYQIEITNVANGCTATETITVDENTAMPIVNTDTLRACPDPNLAQFDLTLANISSESGTSTTYYENSNLSSEITNPENYQSSGATVYASVEFDDNGCASTIEIELLAIPIEEPPNLFDTYLGNICTSQTITVAPPPNTPYNYSWSSLPDGKVLPGTECTALNIDQENIEFSIEISDDSGCIEVVSFPPLDLTVAPSGAKVFRSDNTNILFCNRNDFGEYQWGKESKTTLCAEPMEGETFQDVVIQDLDLETYYYWVMVTDGDCTTKIYLNGENNSPFGKLIIDPNAEYGNLALQVNPNPNNGAFELTITGDEVRDLDLHVYDALGRAIYHRKAPKIAGIETYYIAPPNLTQGLYFIRVTGNNDILLTEKIMVKK